MRVHLVHLVKGRLRQAARLDHELLHEIFPETLEGFLSFHDIRMFGLHLVDKFLPVCCRYAVIENRFSLLVTIQGVQGEHIIRQQIQVVPGSLETSFRKPIRKTWPDNVSVSIGQPGSGQDRRCLFSGGIRPGSHRAHLIRNLHAIFSEIPDCGVKIGGGCGAVDQRGSSLPDSLPQRGVFPVVTVYDQRTDLFVHGRIQPYLGLLTCFRDCLAFFCSADFLLKTVVKVISGELPGSFLALHVAPHKLSNGFAFKLLRGVCVHVNHRIRIAVTILQAAQHRGI